jgi:fatty-acyl-CoA synthase
MFLTELDHPDFKKYDVSSLRTGVMAGTTCSAHLMKRVVKEMNMKDVTICYGMTETSPDSFQTEPEDSFEKRTETVGTVHEHVECKVVDSDGNVVPVGTPGELLTKGYVVMLGYWNDEKRTKESIKQGWMHTGDLATIDTDGYCRIVGRIKDMIIRGGENVFPREVEDFLIKHPGISDVQVIGLPDAKFGEELCAWIIRRPGHSSVTEEDVKQFCKGHIAHYKIPKYILFVDSFPMTLSGKVKKFEMRAETARRLGLSENL